MLLNSAPRDLAAQVRKPWISIIQRLLGHAIRSFGWGLADQAMSTISNFAVSIYVVRELGPAQFGAFSLAYVTYGFALNASRGLATQPLLVRFSHTDLAIWRRAVARCTGTATIVGLAGGACVLVVALLLAGPTRLAFMALGLTLPGLMLQDSWRYSFFALGRGGQAFLNDTIWAVALVPALVFLRLTHNKDIFWFILAWGVTATVAAAVGPAQARVIPSLTGIQHWLSRHGDLGTRFAAESTTSGAAGQLRIYGLTFILGLTAVGVVQTANTLMGPINILFLGMSLVAVPEGARILRQSPRRLPLFCVLMSVGEVAITVSWAVVLLATLPRGLGSWLLGPVWRQTYPLVLPQALWMTGLAASAGGAVGLHTLGAARRSLWAMISWSMVWVVLTLVGASVGGTVGTVRWGAVATWIGALIYWWQLRVALRESAHAPVSGRSSSS